MSETRVSAVITTHNRKDFLLKAVNSVLAQTYPDIELIVVDDASDDGTKELMQKLAEQKGIKYIRIEKEDSKGGNHARNQGILAAKGEFVAFLDDDDEWFSDKIEKQVAVMDKDPEVGVVCCGRIFEYDLKKRVPQDLSKRIEGDLSEKIWQRIAFTTSEILVRRELLLQVGMFDEDLRYWQEYELSIRLCQQAKTALVRENLVLYRVIKKDKSRLTNNIDGWFDAVKYIDKKHEKLLAALSDEMRKKHKLMIEKDAVTRAANIGNKKLQKEHLKQVYRLEPTTVNFIKYTFNIYKLSFWR